MSAMIQFDDRYKALDIKPSDVFEVHTHNTIFLYGNRETPDFFKQMGGFGIIVALGFVATFDAIGMFFLFVIPAMIAQFGTLTYADLTQPCSNIVKTICVIHFQYSVDGKLMEGSQGITANVFLYTYPDQKRIEIKYWPFSPERSVLVYPEFGDGSDMPTLAVVVLGIFTVIFMGVSIIFIPAIIEGTLITIFRANRWPSTTLVVGSVSECTGSYYKTKVGQGFKIKLTFAYQLPDADQVVTKTIHVNRNDLPEEIIPFLGKKVIVVVYKTPRSNRKGERRPSPLNFVL